MLIVGGGIVGAGAALDAASRGLHVAVVEAQDWAAGTSSRSSKLVHGGLRYLQMYDFALVREALAERSLLSELAPHLVQPLPILYPLRHRIVERAYVGSGVLLYDILARLGARRNGGGRAFPMHRQLSRRKLRALAPALAPDRYVGAVQYYDAQVDDARLTLSVVRTAASYGAMALNRMQVVELQRDGDAVTGAIVRSTEDGERIAIRARVVLSATGVWTEAFESLVGLERAMAVRPSKGVHLVVPRERLDLQRALILPTEKSVLFVLPWGAHWIIGTTDTPWQHGLARPAATNRDVEYLLATLNPTLARPLERADIEAVYVGLRPLIAGAGDETTKLSREHAVNRPRPGLVLISGGKLTTYRVMAKDAVDAAVEHARLGAGPSVTARVPIVGAASRAELDDLTHRLARSGLEGAQAERLVGRYGSLAEEVLSVEGHPAPIEGADSYLDAEVAYAVSHEGARHLEDVLERRTRLAIEGRDGALAAAPGVAEVMAARLGWDAPTIEAELAGYEAAVRARAAAELQDDDGDADARLASVPPPLPLP
ncbi:MAG: glycerol-3-phosphate dehydrogenase/oxidase [Actinomycetota bacterium]|nr:glycerol-3-phosphate dehydrogenase/oxidase [Actinomycetota bacterium]